MALGRRQYATSLTDLRREANVLSDGKWSRYDKDVGDAIIKLLSTVSHTVDFYFKYYLDNLFLPCDLIKSKVYLWELVGYKAPYTRAERMQIKLVWPGCGLLNYVPLYKFTPFTVTAGGVEYDFVLSKDYLLSPLTTSISIEIVQGKLLTKKIKVKDIVDNKYKITDTPIDYDLVSLIISGKEWEQKRNIFYVLEKGKYFSLDKEEDGIYLYLQEGWKNYLEVFDNSIILNYLESDSSFQEAPEECMKVSFKDKILDAYGQDVGEGFIIRILDDLDIEDRSLSTVDNDRVITTEDYQNKTLTYPGIRAVKAYDYRNTGVVREPNKVVLVAANEYGKLKNRTKRSIVNYLYKVSYSKVKVEVWDPVIKKIDLHLNLDVGSYKGTNTESDIKLNISSELKEFFSIGNCEIGCNLDEMDIKSTIIRSDERIKFVDFMFPPQLSLNYLNLPVLGTVRYYFDTSSLPIYDTVYFDDNLKLEFNLFDFGKISDFTYPIDVEFNFRIKHTVGEDFIALSKDLFVNEAINVNSSLILNINFWDKVFSLDYSHLESSTDFIERAIFTEKSSIDKK